MKRLSPELEESLAVLSRRGWFAGRSEAVRAALTNIARLRNYDAGQALYLVEDVPNGVFGLVRGSVDISIPRVDGMDLTVHRADPGFWVGDLALLANEKRLVSVIAAEPTRVVHLPDRDIRHLVEKDPRYYADFYALSHENVGTVLRLLGNLATTPSEARVAVRLLLQAERQSSSEAGLRLSQAKLAEMVALSLPTLQRILRRLQEQGMIELGYGQIRIVDHRRLLSLCSDQPPH